MKITISALFLICSIVFVVNDTLSQAGPVSEPVKITTIKELKILDKKLDSSLVKEKEKRDTVLIKMSEVKDSVSTLKTEVFETSKQIKKDTVKTKKWRKKPKY